MFSPGKELSTIMKIMCIKGNLMQGINNVSKAVSTKTTYPILSCIFIEAENGNIKLTANDMEIGIESYVDGTVIENGKVAIEAKLFSDIIRKLPDSEITLETNEDFKTTIKCEKSLFNIAGKSGEDFSNLPEVARDKYITISQFKLKEIINQTIFSLSDNENNNIMTGELFEVSNNKLRVVAIDGHRIAIRNLELKGENNDVKVIVPGKTLNDISKIISGGVDDEVNIYFTEKNILFEFDKTKVVSRLIEGEYFRIDNMLNVDYLIKFNINKKEFLDCLDRSSLLIKDSDKKPIKLTIEDSTLYLKIDSLIGSMNEEIDIVKEGNNLIIGFNPKFLMDAIRVIDDDNITIYMNNKKSPCVIKDEEENYIYLILPMGINEN
jgi:DNA polymerase-3 subunit beta